MEKEKINSENELRKERKKNQSLMIIIIILLLAILAMLAAIFVPTLIDKPQSEIENKEVLEKEIKDIDVITELSIKIDTLLEFKTSEYKPSNSYTEIRFKPEVLKQKLTDEKKQLILLDNMTLESLKKSDYEDFKKTSIYKELAKAYPEDFLLTSTKQISLEKVSKFSEELFGEKITNPVKEFSPRCGSYFYDEASKKYYYPEPQCGGINPNHIESYKSKFEEKMDEAYVYVSFAFMKVSGESDSMGYNFIFDAYKDFDIVNNEMKYKDVHAKSLFEYKIDSTNYKDFKEYKFIFKKDKNDNYYFVKTEPTK